MLARFTWALAMLPLCSAIARNVRTDLLSARLCRVLPCDLRSARAVGACYLEGARTRNDPEALAQRLLADDLGLPGGIDGVTDTDLREIARNRISADFVSGNTVSVSGWVLSRTEARLCAIVALS